VVTFWVDGVMVGNTVYPQADIDQARPTAERLAEDPE
jgi:hypothetical protein